MADTGRSRKIPTIAARAAKPEGRSSPTDSPPVRGSTRRGLRRIPAPPKASRPQARPKTIRASRFPPLLTEAQNSACFHYPRTGRDSNIPKCDACPGPCQARRGRDTGERSVRPDAPRGCRFRARRGQCPQQNPVDVVPIPARRPAAARVKGRRDRRSRRPPPRPSAGRGPFPAGVVAPHPAGAPGLAAASAGSRLAPDGRSGRQQWRRDLCHTAV